MMKVQYEKHTLQIKDFKLGLVCMIVLALIMLPLYPVYAQEGIERDFMEAARDLPPAAQVEFLELIKEPGEIAEALEKAGAPRDLADRLEDRLDRSNIDDIGKIDQVSKMDNMDKMKKMDEIKKMDEMNKVDSLERLDRIDKLEKVDRITVKLETIDDSLERKLANISDDQAIKTERVLEEATKEPVQVAAAEVKVVEPAPEPAEEDPADPVEDPKVLPKEEGKVVDGGAKVAK